MNINLVLFLLLTLSFNLLPAQQDIKLKNMDWLIGTWINTTAKGTTYEAWNKNTDLGFQGRSFKINANDTLVLETIRILVKDNGLYYIPTVSDQNSGEVQQVIMRKRP